MQDSGRTRARTEATTPSPPRADLGDPAGPPGLTQSADGAVVGLVAQGVRAGVTQAEVTTRQDQGVPHVRETHHTLGTVITHFILSHLAGGQKCSQRHRDPHVAYFL